VRFIPKYQAFAISCVLGAAYGLIARGIFGFPEVGEYFEVMSLAFIFGVPVALGFITVWFGDPKSRESWLRCLFLPWISGLLYVLCAMALAWEGLICVVIWLPLVLVLSSFGGFCAGIAHRAFK